MQASRKVKIVGGWAVLFVLALSLYYAVPGLGENEELRQERKVVAQYLQKKYGQDFIIKKVEYYSDYQDVKRELIRTHVVSRDAPPIEFLVSRSVKKPDDRWETVLFLGRSIGTSYLALRLGRELAEPCRDIAEKIFARPVLLYADVSVSIAYDNPDLGNVPTYFELVEKHPEVFKEKGTNQIVEMVFFYDLDETNKGQEAEKIYAFMTDIRRLCAPGTNNKIAINYYKPDFAQEAQKVVASIGLSEFTAIEGGYYTAQEYKKSGRRQWYLFLSKDEMADIKEPADILRYLKKR